MLQNWSERQQDVDVDGSAGVGGKHSEAPTVAAAAVDRSDCRSVVAAVDVAAAAVAAGALGNRWATWR